MRIQPVDNDSKKYKNEQKMPVLQTQVFIKIDEIRQYFVFHFHKIMDDLRTAYNLHNKVIENSELGNYFPTKSYLDPAEIKYQREKMDRKYKKDPATKKLDLKCKKGTFLEIIEKREKTLPSPSSYKPVEYQPFYKKRKFSNLPQRSTTVNEIIKANNKNPTPSPNHYMIKQKSTSLVSFSKSENTNYLDAVVYKASNFPGVGQYNMRARQNSALGKFDKSKRCDSNKQNQLPCPATYNPQHPIELFSQINQKSSKQNFNKQKRFQTKPNNPNKNLCYSGISEWGMKTNYKKKDLLSTLSTHNIYAKSVYYH